MLCCFGPTPWTDPTSAYDAQVTSIFPRQRKQLVITRGNALAAAEFQYPTSPQSTTCGSYQRSVATGGGDLVAVSVPPGVRAGQSIHVAHPDGSGCLIEAQIPSGLTTGSTFYVKAPSREQVSSPTSSLPATPTRTVHSTGYSTVSSYHKYCNNISTPTLPFSQCLDRAGSMMSSTAPPYSLSSDYTYTPNTLQTPVSTKQGLLKVVVPPGTAPGSTLHVQVPGENRLISAQVPENCSEFHVQYNLRPQSPKSPEEFNSTVASTPVTTSTTAAKKSILSTDSCATQLLLVKVPQGTAPGTALHVQVPNEPGRILQAQVPGGNISEFHISYKPSTPKIFNGFGGEIGAANGLEGKRLTSRSTRRLPPFTSSLSRRKFATCRGNDWDKSI